MTYLEVMYHSTKHYEYTQDTIPAVLEQIATLNTDLIALQRWSRRSMATHLKIRSVISFLEHHCPKDRDGGTCRLLIEDYKHIASSLDIYSRRLEAMVPIVTSLIQIIDSHRSLIETANLSRLTHLALVFVPLTFVSGLFSMNETVKPGSKAFWIYFTVAIPLCMLVFLMAHPPRKVTGLFAAEFWKSKRRWVSSWRETPNI